MECKSHFDFIPTHDLPSRNPKKLSEPQWAISTKENVSQEGTVLLLTERCFPNNHYAAQQSHTEGSREKTVDVITSVSIVDREHGCLAVQLRYAVVRVLKERAEVWDDMGCTRYCRAVGDRSRAAVSTDTGMFRSGGGVAQYKRRFSCSPELT